MTQSTFKPKKGKGGSKSPKMLRSGTKNLSKGKPAAGSALPKFGGMQKNFSTKLSMVKKLSNMAPNNNLPAKDDDKMEEIDEDELAIIYYITNLILLEEYLQADSKCEKQISKIKDVS